MSVVIPCLNEAENIEALRRRWRATALERSGHRRRGHRRRQRLRGPQSPSSPRAAGARVVHEPRRGYGSAYLAGFAAARGEYIVMADADLTYDFDEIPRFVERARRRRRARDGRPDGQHPARARCRGCTATSATRCSPGILNLFFSTGVRDAHCGMRALRRDVLPRARPAHDRAWSSPPRWSSGPPRSSLDIREFPIEYHPRGGESQALELPRRLAPPALPARPQPDAPVHHPGRGDGACSARSIALIVLAQVDIFGRAWDLHAMIAGSLLMIVGTQVARARPRARTPTARTSWARRTRGSTACARASGSSTGCCSAARSSLAGARRRRPSSSASGSTAASARSSEERLAVARRDADDRRHPDLLLVVPAQHPRPAPAVRSGAAEARQLQTARTEPQTGRVFGFRARRLMRRLAPGPIGSALVRPEQVADAVLTHHGLVASPRLGVERTSRLGRHWPSSRVLAFQGAVSVALCAGVLGFVLRPVYGTVLFIAGMASTARPWTAPRPLNAWFRRACLGVGYSVSQSADWQLPLRFSASFFRFAPTTGASARRRAFWGRIRFRALIVTHPADT